MSIPTSTLRSPSQLHHSCSTPALRLSRPSSTNLSPSIPPTPPPHQHTQIDPLPSHHFPSPPTSPTAPPTSKDIDGFMLDYLTIRSPSLTSRAEAFHQWKLSRSAKNLWQFSRTQYTAPVTQCAITSRIGGEWEEVPIEGVNFSCQDYLSFNNHPEVKLAAKEAIDRVGVHSSGSALLIGNTQHSRLLESELGEFLQTPNVTLFPTGWGAGYGAITGLVRKRDWVVMDSLSHACLKAGASAAAEKDHVVFFHHNDTSHLSTILSSIRAKDKQNAILVVTEGLFSMDSGSPDLRLTQELAHANQALLMVDCAHDMGALGPGGTGVLGIQGMLGKVDIVMGSFSKTFASNGGYVACRSPALKSYLEILSSTAVFSNALSPVSIAVIRKCLAIIRSPEGQIRRDRLMNNVLHLRSFLSTHYNLHALGDPSPIVPVLAGSIQRARLSSRHFTQSGVHANCVEYPGVPQDAARYRLQVMADHTREEVERAGGAVVEALRRADEEIEGMRAGKGGRGGEGEGE